jgi:starvation-inducible DNA-binding protein
MRVRRKEVNVPGISAEIKRLAIVDGLAHVMGNTCCLSLATMIVQWNIRGPGTAALRQVLNGQRQDMHRALDLIAGRMQALGAPATADESDGVMSRERRLALSLVSRGEALAALVGGHGCLLESLDAALTLSREGEDDATSSLLARRVLAHDQYRVTLGNELA